VTVRAQILIDALVVEGTLDGPRVRREIEVELGRLLDGSDITARSQASLELTGSAPIDPHSPGCEIAEAVHGALTR